MTLIEPSRYLEVIRWLLLRNPFNVPIAENLSPLRLKNRNFLLPRGSPTNPSVVHLAVQPDEQNVSGMMAAALAIEVLARCILPPAPPAGSRPKSHFSLAATNRFIAGTAIPSPNSTPINEI
jgi:hypothetical protein